MFPKLRLISCLSLSLLRITIASLYWILMVSQFRIVCRARPFFRGASKNGLYPFPAALSSTSTQSVAFLGEWVSADMWHKCLGHPSQIFQRIVSSSGLPLVTKVLSFCEFCRFGKTTKLPFHSPVSVSHSPLELIHSDVWGKTPTTSVTGSNIMFWSLMIFQNIQGCFLYAVSLMFVMFSLVLNIRLRISSLRIKRFRSDEAESI